jgi:hypothetical protein
MEYIQANIDRTKAAGYYESFLGTENLFSNNQKALHILLKQVYSFSTFLVKILSLFTVCCTYYNILITYSFSTETATSFLPNGYSSQNSVVVVIVCVYDTYLCQKILPHVVSQFLIKGLT